MERIRLPSPSFSFEASRAQGAGYQWSIGCFPLADRKVLCMDQCGLAFLFDGETRHVVTVPPLHKPKLMPVSLFVPSAHGDGGGSLFLMESCPRPEARCSGQPSDEFEVLVYRKASMTSPSKSWQSQLLPPPPYVHDPSYRNRRSEISSYAVVHGVAGRALICISVNGIGTYCLDTAAYTWSEVGKWTLPFIGKVEYVPELRLWFGLSADAQHLAAADLSTMDSQPQLVGSWKELNPLDEWEERQMAQVVNLGSGRFCISRFFRSSTMDEESYESLEQKFVVFTGVEVVQRVHDGNGKASSGDNGTGDDAKVELEMILHKSRCHTPVNRTRIKAIF
uniref:F-box associated domain-containing protein n=1 Tax=Arundo donax TaxID=35708 RepID=A0A0A8Y6V6_ARUDO